MLNVAWRRTLGTTYRKTFAAAWDRWPLAREIILVPVALSTLFLVTFRDCLTGTRSFATFQDNTYLILPIFHHISKSFSRGEYPYWMNTIVTGLPLYNVPQLSVTYPLYFFHFGLYGTALDALYHVHYVIILHLFLLYLNTYVLLRVLRLPVLPSLLGASLFTFSANTLDYSVWVNTIAPYCWFPLIIASVVLILDNRNAKVGVILGAVSFALLILASPAQPLIHVTYFIGLLYVFHVLRCLRNKDTSRLFRTTANLVVMGILSLMIAAPSLFPALFDNKGMIRFLGDYPPLVGFSKIPFNAFLTGQLSPGDLAGTLLPLAVPRIIGNSFIGMSAVLLALFAIFKVRTNWVIAPLFLISVYALLSSTGTHLGLARLNYYLPLINRIREPPRHLFLFTFGVSILAAFGFAYLTDVLSRGYRELLNWRSMALIAVFAVLIVLALNAQRPYAGAIPKIYLLATFIAVVCLLLSLPLQRGWGKSLASLVAILLIIYANQQYPQQAPRLNDGDYFSASNLMSHRILEELAKLDDSRNYRFIFADAKFPSMFWSMNASYHDLRSFQGYMNPLPVTQFMETFQRFDLHNYYPLLGAKYYLCNPCEETLLRDFKFDREISGYKLNTANQALPRYAIVNRMGGTYANPDDFYNKVHTGYDFWKEAYVSEQDATKIANWLDAGTAPLTYVLKEENSSLNRLRVSVNAQGRAIFILNEYYNKAWKARINGVPVKTFKVNLNQVGILIESGSNLVDFEYYPTIFIRLLWLQRITFVGLLVYVIYLVAWSKRSIIGRRSKLKSPLLLA